MQPCRQPHSALSGDSSRHTRWEQATALLLHGACFSTWHGVASCVAEQEYQKFLLSTELDGSLQAPEPGSPIPEMSQKRARISLEERFLYFHLSILELLVHYIEIIYYKTLWLELKW